MGQGVKPRCVDKDGSTLQLQINLAVLIAGNATQPVQGNTSGQCVERHLFQKTGG